MKYTSLLDNIERTFSSFKKPSIIYANPTDEPITKGEYLKIQHDFAGLSRDQMTYEQCSMMLVDGALISDEALCYFLPRLARAVFQEGGNEYLLYRRLERINKSLLNQEHQKIVDCLITSLKEFEQEKEMEEEKELEQAQIDWEQERLVSEKIEDKLFLAIARGDFENVKILINQGANVNEKDNYGNSPLDIARYRGHTKIVELLKQAGAR